MSRLELFAPDGVGEITAGTDLAQLVGSVLALADGDVVVVTSKAVSKAEGRLVPGDRDAALAGQTVRVVARRGPVSIVENPLGLVLAAAGIDASNLPAGMVALLPLDPDRSARALREALYDATGCNVGVVISDTAGRAWRLGQTDLAIGVAGLEPLDSFAGRVDGYGNELAVTEPAVADEVASAAELAAGKLAGRPVVRLRGLGDRVLAPGVHGPGARSVVRPREEDLFALGARAAVIAAVSGADRDCFGTPASVEELIAALDRAGLAARAEQGEDLIADTDDAAAATRCAILAHAHGWVAQPGTPATRLRPGLKPGPSVRPASASPPRP